MAKRRRTRPQSQQASGPNWFIIGGISAVAVLGILGLLIASSLNPQAEAEPTAVLTERVSDVASYCLSNPERCLITGNPDATINMVEIADYGCPHCRDFNDEKAPTLQAQYVETGDVYWMVMPFAIQDGSAPSAAAVLCAGEQSQEIGYAFHETIFGLQDTGSMHTNGGFMSVAANVPGMDESAFEVCIEEGRYDQAVSFNRQAARQVGISSTPTFFLNGALIRGNQEMEVFIQRINALLGS